MPSCLRRWISSACGVCTHPGLLVRKKRGKGRREKRSKITIRRTTSEGPMRIYEEARRDKTCEENFSSRQRSISNKSRQESLYDKKKAKMMVFFLSSFCFLLSVRTTAGVERRERERNYQGRGGRVCMEQVSSPLPALSPSACSVACAAFAFFFMPPGIFFYFASKPRPFFLDPSAYPSIPTHIDACVE